MQVVQVDVVDAQALERGVARLMDVLRRAVDTPARTILAALDAEFGRQDDLVSPVGDCLADELLVGEGPVHVGGVQEVDAEVERAADRLDGAVLVGGEVNSSAGASAKMDARGCLL